MKSHATISIRMIWMVGFILAATTFISAGSYAADDLNKSPAGDELRDRQEDINKGVESQAHEADPNPSDPDASSGTTAEQKEPETERPAEVTVEKIEEGQWKIIKPNGNPAGKIMTRPQGGYKFYDTNNLNMGVIHENGIWRPRGATRKTTNVGPHEVQLYLYALDALEKI